MSQEVDQLKAAVDAASRLLAKYADRVLPCAEWMRWTATHRAALRDGETDGNPATTQSSGDNRGSEALKTSPDVVETEPRPSKARIVFTLELDGTLTREQFGDWSAVEELQRMVEDEPSAETFYHPFGYGEFDSAAGLERPTIGVSGVYWKCDKCHAEDADCDECGGTGRADCAQIELRTRLAELQASVDGSRVRESEDGNTTATTDTDAEYTK